MIIKELVLGPLVTNCYIVGCDDTKEAVIIDPADESEKILGVLEDNDWQAKHILLTHGHIDHVGALMEVRTATGATILMHGRERMILRGLGIQAILFGLKTPKIGAIDQLVTEGDKILIGNSELIILETPGHSLGSVSFLGPNCVFVGDVLFAGSIGRTDLPGASHKSLVHSICEKLMVLPDDTIVYSGHGPTTTISREKVSNPFISC